MKRLLAICFLGCTLLASAFAAKVTFHASITADQEVPATMSPIWGVANLELDPATGAFQLVVNLKNVNETLGASHIHLGAAGTNGGILVHLGGESAYRRSAGKNLHGKFTGTIPPEQLEAMLVSGTYLNFHTATYPGGAARGQLVANPVALWAELAAANEVPPNDSPATGFASVIYHPATKKISVGVEIVDFTNIVSGSHIHSGAAGVNGPVTLNLGGEDAYTRTGSSLSGEFLWRDYMHPAVPLLTGNTYINVHSTVIPAGEIRGQIVGD
jgi:hypothetical protein